MTSVHTSCVSCGGDRSTVLFQKDGYDLVQCAACGLVYVGNPPAPETLRKTYSFESGYHEKLTQDGPQQAEFLRRAQGQFDRIRALRTPGRILDVGCSVGFFLDSARQAGWQVSGVEFSPDTAEVARQRLGGGVYTGALQDAPLEPGQLDVVTMWDVLEHVPDPMSTLAKASAALKKDGLLVLETPNVDGWFPRASLKVAGALGYWPHPEPPGHLFQFSVASLTTMLEKAGFVVDQVQHDRIPISYSFGKLSYVLTSPKRFAYFAAFAPLAWFGPWFGAGDSMFVVARKKA